MGRVGFIFESENFVCTLAIWYGDDISGPITSTIVTLLSILELVYDLYSRIYIFKHAHFKIFKIFMHCFEEGENIQKCFNLRRNRPSEKLNKAPLP